MSDLQSQVRLSDLENTSTGEESGEVTEEEKSALIAKEVSLQLLAQSRYVSLYCM